MEIVCDAHNLGDWLKQLEEHENKQPEDLYYVKVSAKLMCRILREFRESEARSQR